MLVEIKNDEKNDPFFSSFFLPNFGVRIGKVVFRTQIAI